MGTLAKTILVVDDDMILREMYEARLKEEGYTIISASNGEEALDKAIMEKPDLILLDIMMPKVNGIDVMKKLRESGATSHIPIILLTALMKEVDKVKAMMTDGDAYLIKSEIMPGDVVRTIEESIAKADATA
ncbi:MAG: Alkaline phosphatase synthesis transcriptional regulatory protein PhoP [bacterium ADurb.Bin400]|nr:MAG: Alkaline phosphatase synthesis transcriptional regulatory protein PhoP [bacterium ADurb.Bin400]